VFSDSYECFMYISEIPQRPLRQMQLHICSNHEIEVASRNDYILVFEVLILYDLKTDDRVSRTLYCEQDRSG